MRDDTLLDTAWVEVLSGLGEKGPACIRLWTGRALWVLDVGVGPEATSPFNPHWLEGAERVFITHDHIDHIGGAAHAVAAGLPIHCTAQTAHALPPSADVHLLPNTGQTVVEGITLTTGRNGHALGGVWFHFDLGDGLFFSGDWSEESDWFAFDTPPQALTALIDASYHLDDIPQTQRKEALDKMLAQNKGRQILFPVPPSGRAGELALHLMGKGDVSLDDMCRQTIARALQTGTLSDAAAQLTPLIEREFDPSAEFLICDTPNADAGMAWQIVQDWRDIGRLGHEALVLFTGHMTAHARAIAAQGGMFVRWNVHPPLTDQINMIATLGAQNYTPLFCSQPEDYLLEPRIRAAMLMHERSRL
ncbi:glyoxylase-like metal-dependent hydrolase (beta-lactamase superfamily II) [Sulfitobacter undariae]|uniref:Glyoxylase-like metal-dependent hydrolase (Beta-lactamase superfamily II) n=1 Tax=Sulfitobacter undariae TaxID=1563671 RepID=A0A7W6H1Y5_9RHOB|nr:MBL fold metallo-hydrolase [Sulfitobacter undariae]MBB3995672.1 glyoxylase-like metal-dependent hydrolase (beta-lactamase superfamily II) [Sulfitobacter undariae]